MFNEIISQKVKLWLASPECKVKNVVDYIRTAGYLREPQIEAIEVYLYLKIAGENKPLWQLLSEGFFSTGVDLSKLEMSVEAREVFENSIAARSIFEFVRAQSGNTTSNLSANEKLIAKKATEIDFNEVSKQVFYNAEYNDYLFSLPMGAGKTFLMAALMYLDLYFATNEPDNKLFAHNFLILVPSGLKSSIVPSLKTIERFDPSWVIPEPAASNLRKLIKFEILDEAKSAKKSNKARNPNVQKIARHQPFEDLVGLIAVVNAEKVILDRLELDKSGHLFERSEDEKDAAANELRNFIGKIPNLQIHIDEVHHATKDDIKLRQVVNKWNARGNVNGVLGFSGTPYLDSRERFVFGENITLVSEMITNTVYYYPLISGVQTFLKKPEIKAAEQGLSSIKIVQKGVEGFREKFGSLVYADGNIAKLAIYCGTIERLEEEVFPFLTGEMGINPAQILKFHKGNKRHPQPTDSELEFKMLDEPSSGKQIVLLVQIGKEGWDCRSLTGVILSQAGDCPTNMVLQASCRCLRQVEKDKIESALIWLSQENAVILNKQLKDRQKTSIAELNQAGKAKSEDEIERHNRIPHLKLPTIKLFQLAVEYDTITTGELPNPRKDIPEIDVASQLKAATVTTTHLANPDTATTSTLIESKGAPAEFNRWLFQISKESFGNISVSHLLEFGPELRPIFERVTLEIGGSRFINDFYDVAELNRQIRLAFHTKREFTVKRDLIEEDAHLLIVERLRSIAKPKFYLPNEQDTKDILAIDKKGISIDEARAERSEAYEKIKETVAADIFESWNINVPNGYPPNVNNKDRSFHILPYWFDSGLEKDFFEKLLQHESIAELELEVYFNGESNLTEFRIACYGENGGKVGDYFPDFLVIKRKDGQIHRILIIETKGELYSNVPKFQKKRRFTETEFLRINNEQARYNRFEYLYLESSDTMTNNVTKFVVKAKEFFKD